VLGPPNCLPLIESLGVKNEVCKLIKIIILISFLLLQPLNAEVQAADDIPQWLAELIQKHYAGKKNPVSISEHQYHDKHVFVVDRSVACCDLGATMYHQNGERICRLIGLIGSWENTCRDFPKNNKLIRLIYEYKVNT